MGRIWVLVVGDSNEGWDDRRLDKGRSCRGLGGV